MKLRRVNTDVPCVLALVNICAEQASLFELSIRGLYTEAIALSGRGRGYPPAPRPLATDRERGGRDDSQRHGGKGRGRCDMPCDV